MSINFKPISKCDMEELAARQSSVAPSGGVLFARKADEDQKNAARQLVLDLFHPDRRDGYLQILTIPGVELRFERKLLGMRESGWMRSTAPHRTAFTSVESDRAIYYSAVTQMPGLHTPNSVLKRARPFPFAEIVVKTRFASFFFANVDDFLSYEWPGDGWHAAWLDYTGPMTVERLVIIERFYRLHVKETLIVTALKTRWRKPAVDAIGKAGGYFEWLGQHLPGEVLHKVEYFDTSPMAQFAVRKS